MMVLPVTSNLSLITHHLSLLSMRIVLIFSLLLPARIVTAQPSFFLPVPLITETIDSVVLFSKNPRSTANEGVMFYHSEDGMNMAFRQKDGGIWLTSLMPFDSPPSVIRRVQIDGKGSDDWVIFGNTIEHVEKGLQGITSVLVFSLDEEPKELFTADHYCWEWKDRDSSGEGEFTHGYGYDLLFTEGTLKVTALQRPLNEWCALSPLHAGTYHWTDKGFRIPGVVSKPKHRMTHKRNGHQLKGKKIHRHKRMH
jgi:hypothetical protein